MPIFAYFGPETLMPLTSIFAAVIGVFLMFGKNTFRLIAGLFGNLGRIFRKNSKTPAPHIAQDGPTAGPSALERRRAKARSAAPAASDEDHGQ